MRYQPRLANGELVALPWPLRIYKALNHVAWPLEDNVSTGIIWLERFTIFIGFLVFCEHHEVDMAYLIAQRHDLDQMLEGMPTYLILLELQIRVFHLALHKTEFKRLLQRFYAGIYVRDSDDAQIYQNIQRNMLPTRINCIVYMLTYFNFFVSLFHSLLNNHRVMLYKQHYPFDNFYLPYYIPLLCLNAWVGLIIDTMIFGELNVLGELMMHLNACYLVLQKQLQKAAAEILAQGHATRMATQYRRVMNQVLQRNVELNQFGAQLEAHFTFRVFIMFGLSSVLLCVMGFKSYTNPMANIVYMVWAIAKFVELLTVGMLGAVLYKTTDELHLMYYCSSWEQIVYRSQNTRENILLMKTVTLAIQMNSRPFFITGMGFFPVNLSSAIKILQVAFSYFTFLTSLGGK